MPSDYLPAALTLLSAFAIAAVASPFAGWLGRRLGVVDAPGGRRQHRGLVPRIGGVGLFAGFFVTALGLYLAGVVQAEHRQPIIGLLLGTGFVFVFGLADDRYNFKAAPQFVAQLVAAGIAIAFTIWIEVVTLPFTTRPTTFPWFITYPLTVAWVVVMMNTVNFLDGLDGLASGVGAIAASLFAIHSYRLNQPETALYSLALAGACLGFLVFNVHPARIFLGSAGALTLGYVLATLSILAPARVMTALLIMVVPVVDTGFQAFDRWRRGKSPFRGDRGHLHFRLLDRGYSQRAIVFGYWAFCAVFGAMVLFIPRVYKLVALGLLGVAVVVVLMVLSRARPSGSQAAHQSQDSSAEDASE